MSFPVLMYHAISDVRGVITTSPERFAWQMAWLYNHDFNVAPLSWLIEQLYAGHHVPDRTIAITFDDGFEGVYRYAFPVLDSYGFTATVFIITDYTGRDNAWPGQPKGIPRLPLMTWSQVGEIARHGFTIGSHTRTHPSLDRISAEEAQAEVVESKAIIENRLGQPADEFAFPYGHGVSRLKALVSETYRVACSTELRVGQYGVDRSAVPRVDAFYLNASLQFRLLGSPFLLWYLSLRRSLRAALSPFLQHDWA